jgi:hypothetical protein
MKVKFVLSLLVTLLISGYLFAQEKEKEPINLA